MRKAEADWKHSGCWRPKWIDIQSLYCFQSTDNWMSNNTIIWGHAVYDNFTTRQHGSELSSQQYLNIDNGYQWHGDTGARAHSHQAATDWEIDRNNSRSPEQTWYLHLKLHIIVPPFVVLSLYFIESFLWSLKVYNSGAVSYTHLTLPTIPLV